jgi:hypothetical protein
MPRKAIEPMTRLLSMTEITDTCWLWHGPKCKDGYGSTSRPVEGQKQYKSIRAHRYMYELIRGPIPEGKLLHHICAVKECINPSHLMPVSVLEHNRMEPNNLAGANIRKTHCPKGHPYNEQNTRMKQGRRCCIECCRKDCRERARARSQKEQEAERL